jgi:hypothetical protein
VPAPCVVVCFSMRIVRGIPDSRVQLGIPSRRVLDCTVGNGSLISVGGVILVLMAGCCKILHAFGITCLQHEAAEFPANLVQSLSCFMVISALSGL